jgi:thiamine-monophosphate kinase
MRLDEAGESEIIRRLLPHLATDGLLIRPGRDDATAWMDDAGITVASCDASVEGVHFDLSWQSPEDAGRRALALALGDLAAKGARPTYGLITLAAPAHWEIETVEGMYAGMAGLAREVGLRIAGGDTTAIDGPAVLSITVLGRADVRPLGRSEALPGWAVAVTGPLGGAAVALRERRPFPLTPRLVEGAHLNAAGACCGDISDGLIRELEKFLSASGAGSRIEIDRVPRAPRATALDALASGEEAELLCVAPAHVLETAGLSVIGTMTDAAEVVVLDRDGNPMEIRIHGHEHFA